MTSLGSLLLAHGVGRVYESPIPVSYYLVGAALTVAASFLIRALARSPETASRGRLIGGARVAGAVLGGVRGYLLTVFGLVIVFSVIYRDQAGFAVPALTFWICLIIIPIVLCAVVDGLWPAASPWTTLENLYRYESAEDGDRAHRAAPWWIAPTGIYALFWFELVSGRGFDALAILLVVIVYTVYVLSFRRAQPWPPEQTDPLGILFGFAQRVAPLRLGPDGIVYRGFTAGLDDDEPMPTGLFIAAFVLLASTTLDNVRETVEWFDFQKAFGLDTWNTIVLDSVALAALTLPFALPFFVCAALARLWAAKRVPLTTTARLFGWSLIPIGIAYVLAHNMPLVVIGLPQLVRQLAEGLGSSALSDYVPSPLFVWVVEIALIVGGHVVGVLAAHRAAVRIAGSHTAALKSHVALTLLMSLFTITTLWLLSLPIVVT